jgi:prophage regulatory protein
MRLLSYSDLKPLKGIAYSKVQIWRLEKLGKFPKRVRLGPGRHAWAESEVDEWITERIGARDAAVSL